MRIGELLVEQRKLRQSELTRALAEKPADKRLCSFLIARGLVDFDDASRALGEQKGVACALAKHLAGRDPELANLIPAELGRASCALPIGRRSTGAVIVCVRDPSASVLAALRQATSAEILMVIAPASRLEHLVLSSYGAAPNDEFDVDFSTTGMGDNMVTSPPTVAAKVAAQMPPMPDMEALDPASVRLALTDLDDVRVDRDPTQSGQIPKFIANNTPPRPTPALRPTPVPAATAPSRSTPVPAAAAPPSRPTPVPAAAAPPSRPTPVPAAAAPQRSTPVPEAAVPAPPRVPANPPIATPRRAQTSDPRATRPMSLGAMSVGLEHATTREAATDLVLAYVATRWRSGLVLAIRDRSAIGYRGHGVTMPELVSVPLSVPSTIQRAVETKVVSADFVVSPAQDALVRALSDPATPAAAPVLVGGQPVAVIAVGDPIDSESTVELAAADLGMLAEALSSAYQRILAR